MRQSQKQGLTGTEEQSISLSHGDLCEIMCKEKIHTAFPNVEAILRRFLSLMVTNCLGERSFSRLKSIKNKLISTMSKERLSALSILSVESDKFKQINFDELLHDFALTKARKKFCSLVLLYLMAVTISYVLANKLYNYYKGCLIKEIKIKSKTALTKFLFFSLKICTHEWGE